MRVTLRRVLVFGLLALVLWGLFQILDAVKNQGLVEETTCTGINLGPDDEEAGQLMRPGDGCSPGDQDSGIRTYAQQRDFQRQQHQRVIAGAWYVGAGVAGLALLGPLSTWQARAASRSSRSASSKQ
jgi:hypothetical protein